MVAATIQGKVDCVDYVSHLIPSNFCGRRADRPSLTILAYTIPTEGGPSLAFFARACPELVEGVGGEATRNRQSAESFFTTGASQRRRRRRTSFGCTLGSRDRSRSCQTSGELLPFRYPSRGCARPIPAPLRATSPG